MRETQLSQSDHVSDEIFQLTMLNALCQLEYCQLLHNCTKMHL